MQNFKRQRQTKLIDPNDSNSDDDDINEYHLYNEKHDSNDEEGEEERDNSHGGLRISKNTADLIKDIMDLFNQSS